MMITHLFITIIVIIRVSLSINITSISANDVDLLPSPSVGLCVCQSVSLSVWKVYCGKTANWIRMPFGMVSGVGQRMGVLDAGGDNEVEGAVLGLNLGVPLKPVRTLLHSCVEVHEPIELSFGVVSVVGPFIGVLGEGRRAARGRGLGRFLEFPPLI